MPRSCLRSIRLVSGLVNTGSSFGRRVTVDCDGVDRWDSTVRMLIARSVLVRGGAGDVRVDLTRRGFHVVAWFPVAVDVDYFRCLCGDCGGRLFVDGLVGGGMSRQILFGEKGGFDVRKAIKVC